MADGRGNYTRCETRGCKKKATSMRPYRHCKTHALLRAVDILKVQPALMWSVAQIIEFEVERQVERVFREAREHEAGNQG